MRPQSFTRLRRILAVSFGAGLLLLAGLTVAEAVPEASGAPSYSDATVAARTFSVDGGKVGDASVACPAGRRAVGGGVGQTAAASPYSGQLQQSGPVDDSGLTANTDTGDVARSWSVSVSNPGATRRDYRVFALCSASSDATISVSGFSISHGAGGRYTSCPSGTRATGGGLGQTAATSPPFGSIQTSAPLDASGAPATTASGQAAASWSGFAVNSADRRDYRVLALCSAATDATVVARNFSVAAGRSTDAAVACPSGKRAVGGGVGQLVVSPPYGVVQQSAPVDATGQVQSTADGDVARSWLATVYNSTARDYRVFVLCASDSATTGPIPTSPMPTTPKPDPYAPFCGVFRATIAGTSGDDVLTGTPGRDVIAGLGGNDLIRGGGGNDLLCGGDGNDRIFGDGGDDTINGGDGNDRIDGGAGVDVVYGGNGRDNLTGGSGDDRLYGGPDDDRLQGGPGQDTLDGGTGVNRVQQ